MRDVTACPTCGQPMPRKVLREATALLRFLQSEPERDVYKGQDGNWYVTRGGVDVTWEAIEPLVRSGKLRRRYSDVDDYFTTERTIDIPATLAARKKHGNRTELIYVGETEPR